MGPIPYRRTTLSSPNTMTMIIKNDLVISSKCNHVGTEKGASDKPFAQETDDTKERSTG